MMMLCLILFIVFATLRITGVVKWSWWGVTAPLWLPVVIIATLAAVLSGLMEA